MKQAVNWLRFLSWNAIGLVDWIVVLVGWIIVCIVGLLSIWYGQLPNLSEPEFSRREPAFKRFTFLRKGRLSFGTVHVAIVLWAGLLGFLGWKFLRS